jgi:hypothetical protein
VKVEEKILYPKTIVKRSLPKNYLVGNKKIFQNEISRQIPVISIKAISNCFFDYDEYLFTNTKIFEESYFRRSWRKKTSIFRKLKILLSPVYKKVKKVDNSFFIIDPWSTGYFHWFGDVIHKYFMLKENNYEGKLLLPEKFKEINFAVESLNFFSIPHIFIKKKELAFSNRLYLFPYKLISGNYVENITLAINNIVNFTKITPKKTIYVSRNKAKYRKLVNEVEVIKMLKKYGVEIFNFDNLSLTEQIKIAKETYLFISIHGAALTNMLFMNKSQNILEIRHPDSEIQNCYFSLASALKHNYFYFLGAPMNKDSNPHDGNLKVEVESFENLLKTII